MMAKKIMEAVHETAKGLRKAGTLDAKTMREFDALCLPPVKTDLHACADPAQQRNRTLRHLEILALRQQLAMVKQTPRKRL